MNHTTYSFPVPTTLSDMMIDYHGLLLHGPNYLQKYLFIVFVTTFGKKCVTISMILFALNNNYNQFMTDVMMMLKVLAKHKKSCIVAK